MSQVVSIRRIRVSGSLAEDPGSRHSRDADPVTAHDYRLRFALGIQASAVHRVGILGAQFEDMPDLDQESSEVEWAVFFSLTPCFSGVLMRAARVGPWFFEFPVTTARQSL
jgi:hypothetical protein